MNPSRFKYPLQGLYRLLKKDHNFLVHLIIAALVIGFGFCFNISKVEWLFVTSAIFMVLIVEVLNTAIEYAVDLSTDSYNLFAKYAKDVAAFAVVLACIYAVVIGFTVFIPYIIQIF
ncbi:diacylglycerol kinase family protein [Jeotgalicoccus sp. S0W5]|uniref:diacylglycerol kinase family protein n=1 Tax=Jeotgalicoccus sp. S0W5 TaxID=2527874 RepID=UPI001414DE19|nr:diacylglycerol kinase family protein [Jeotgalicoccus sp. S0W5]